MAYELSTTSEYLRAHETLLVRVDLSGYLIEYYHHRKEFSPETKSAHDEKLKDLIACFAIHLTSRMPNESHAWTLHIVADEPYSLFVTGESGEMEGALSSRGILVGNVLTDHIRHSDVNGFHAQFTHRGQTSKSYSSSESSDITAMVEKFYEQSEQRPLRIKISDNSDTAIGMVALPGCDLEWFAAVDLEELAGRKDHDTAPMRSCSFEFRCPCSPEKLIPFFRGLPEETLTELYGGDAALTISCPRCGRRFEIDRSDLD